MWVTLQDLLDRILANPPKKGESAEEYAKRLRQLVLEGGGTNGDTNR